MRLPVRRRYSSRNPLGIVLSLIFLVLVTAVGFRGFLLYKDSKLGKFGRFNVVLVTKPVTLLSVNLADKTATAVIFPDDLYIPELAYGYGGYKASAIYAVGQLDKRGGDTVAATVSDYLGIPVDGYIYDPVSLPKDIKGFFLGTGGVVGGQSDLNVLDRGRLAWVMLQTRLDKIKLVKLSDFAEPLVLADGSTAESVDKETLDGKLQGDFTERRIRDEDFRLEVVNSTRILGLGNRASRILTNIGTSVVNVGTTDVQIGDCQIQSTAKTRGSITVARISDVFSCQVLPPIEEGRSEVIVTLGTEYAKALGK